MVAGGTESMSNAPYLLKGARWGYRMGHAEAIDSLLAEGLTCAINPCHMGITAEEVASRYGVSRADQDAFAAESQRRAAQAIQDGSFTAEIVPVDVPQKKGEPLRVDTDEYPRPGTTVEKLAALKPAFKKDGTVTAGNASGINDGAAALVVTTARQGEARSGTPPLARILAYASTGVDPEDHGDRPGSRGPQGARARRPADGRRSICSSSTKRSPRSRWRSCASCRLDPAKVNVNGGAIALGHPIGASGARVLTTLIYALRARKLRYGVASLCIGGGMGIAMAVEAL